MHPIIQALSSGTSALSSFPSINPDRPIYACEFASGQVGMLSCSGPSHRWGYAQLKIDTRGAIGVTRAAAAYSHVLAVSDLVQALVDSNYKLIQSKPVPLPLDFVIGLYRLTAQDRQVEEWDLNTSLQAADSQFKWRAAQRYAKQVGSPTPVAIVDWTQLISAVQTVVVDAITDVSNRDAMVLTEDMRLMLQIYGKLEAAGLIGAYDYNSNQAPAPKTWTEIVVAALEGTSWSLAVQVDFTVDQAIYLAPVGTALPSPLPAR